MTSQQRKNGINESSHLTHDQPDQQPLVKHLDLTRLDVAFILEYENKEMADFSASAPMGTFQPGTAAAATSIVELSMAAR